MPALNFTPFPNLDTGRLHLRQLEMSDDHEIFLLRSDEKHNEFVDRPRAASIEDAQAFIQKISQGILENKWVFWVICLKDSNKLTGTIGYWNISPGNDRAEIGYELLPAFQGKGIMQEAISKIIEYGFVGMNLKIIVAFSHRDNQRSLRLLEKHNFKHDLTLEDEMDEAENMLIYSLKKEDHI